MRDTILHEVLTKACRTALGIMAKGFIMASALPVRCFLFLLPDYIRDYANIIH